MRWMLGLALVTTALSLPASAQSQSDDWEIVLAPYALAGSVTGGAGVGTTDPIPVDLDFTDLLDFYLKMAAMGHVEVWKGNWGVMGDAMFLRIGSDLPTPRARVLDIELAEAIVEALLARRFVGSSSQLDLFAGVRYWDLDLDVELIDTPLALDVSESWFDPVVGGRVLQDLSEDWFLTARGDMGGFGVSSSFSWNVQGGIGWEAANVFSLVLEYRALGVDYANDGAGRDFLSYDTTMHGPLLGFVFHF